MPPASLANAVHFAVKSSCIMWGIVYLDSARYFRLIDCLIEIYLESKAMIMTAKTILIHSIASTSAPSNKISSVSSIKLWAKLRKLTESNISFLLIFPFFTSEINKPAP